MTDALHTHGELIAFRETVASADKESTANMTAENASNWILEHTPTAFQVM